MLKLEDLIEKNSEYFGETAGAGLAHEKDEFDKKVEKGRYASVVKNQEFYKELIETLDKADQHMKQTMQEATDLLHRVIQVSPDAEETARKLAEQIVTETMDFDRTSS